VFSIKDLKFDFKTYVGKHPSLYFLYGLYPKFKHRIVRKNTDICIEGFPRSGNTFTYHAFKYFNPDLVIGHHIHAPVQPYLAQKFNIPCLIMIRHPLNSAASLIIVDNKLSIDSALKHYIHYYEELIKYSDHIFLADINTIVNSFDKIVDKINSECNKKFKYKAISKDKEKEIKQIVEKQNEKGKNPQNLVAIPSNRKEQLKKQIKPEIRDNQLYPRAIEAFNQLDRIKISSDFNN